MRVTPERLDGSILEGVARLRDDFPGVPLVALGQTVFWDEPVKAALFAVLDTLDPAGHAFCVGINDHDYFSKTAAPLPEEEPFTLLEHNDGSTRDLWVATGELSMLFGSETIPTRELLRDHGCELEKVAQDAAEGRDPFIDRVTTAWGWRGIAQTGERREIAHEIRLSAILPYLVELLQWGMNESAALLGDASAREQACAFAEELVDLLRRFDAEHPGALLSDAYRDVHLFFYRKLVGSAPSGVHTFTSTDAFLFNPTTVERPRFRILDVFLRPESRDIARRAYDAALEGSSTYTLDRFGPGAIPFDLVVPGRGRGTIRVLPDGVAVATQEPLWLPTDTPVESAADLAALTERHLGDGVALVGKGHVFVCGVTAEAILVFHEGGSAYVSRTARLLQMMADAGVRVPLYPILRVRHHTWKALAGMDVPLRLPEHLAAAFGTETISGDEFAGRLDSVVAGQERLLREVAALGGTRDLVAFLAERNDGEWTERLAAYTRAHDLLLAIRDRSQAFEEQSQRLYAEIARLKQEVQEIEAEKGRNYRERIKPLRERLWELTQVGGEGSPEGESLQREIAAREAERAAFDTALAERRQRLRELDAEVKSVRKARMENEKGGEAAQARREIAAIERHAELARLELVRKALLVTRGLSLSNWRPSAWWFPLVDPSGRWFENLAHTMELYFEPLSPDVPQAAPAACVQMSG